MGTNTGMKVSTHGVPLRVRLRNQEGIKPHTNKNSNSGASYCILLSQTSYWSTGIALTLIEWSGGIWLLSEAVVTYRQSYYCDQSNRERFGLTTSSDTEVFVGHVTSENFFYWRSELVYVNVLSEYRRKLRAQARCRRSLITEDTQHLHTTLTGDR